MGVDRGVLRLCQPATGWYLRLVGAVRVSGTADSWESRAVGSRKARTLLAYLGAQRQDVVTVDQVIDALWDGAPPQEPEANVATLVSRLRGRFGPDVITGGRSGYRLGESVQVDLYEASALVVRAETLANTAHSLLVAEQAMKVLDDLPVLAEYPAAAWAEEARALQDSLLRRAWHAAADSALRTGAPRLAQVLAETLISRNAVDEKAYQVLMRACVTGGDSARAVVTYQRLRSALAAEKRAPSAASRDLVVEILRTDAATG
ncbi:DNA-binding SARP family transcriptional activator [Kibdelosporangium banguiense]|uniref:DNA-binding SARP family transcriptional activator n=1 Tax=Kibdelosporangium banguiense TaxID=1365924 RepID=A0ABS4TMD4_9PSEU|nr:BTAD domain-containing putative transcriptional regulator [Kibdelosporangium banguiense]MBP2325164.1 DNA-binding SARP family transcriptional activator [Kibdelosporangium banguiense]